MDFSVNVATFHSRLFPPMALSFSGKTKRNRKRSEPYHGYKRTVFLVRLASLCVTRQPEKREKNDSRQRKERRNKFREVEN
jgi:hypothetical protein